MSAAPPSPTGASEHSPEAVRPAVAPPPTSLWRRRLASVVGGVLLLPLAIIGGLWRLFAGAIGQRGRLIAFARALARSSRIGRFLAAGGAASVLILSVILLELAPGSPWSAAWIGVLLGVGGALLILPEWLGWPRRMTALVAINLLMLSAATEWLRTTLAPATWPAGLGSFSPLLGALLPSLLLGGGGLLFLPTFLGGNSSLIGLLAALGGGLLLSALGAGSILNAVTAVIDLWPGPGKTLVIEFLAATAVWLAALALAAMETRLPPRWSARLLLWRSVLLYLGGVLAGVGVALQLYPPLFVGAWRLLFATPFEGLAVAASALLSTLAGLMTAAFFLLLPRVLARRQLAGRLTATAAGEAGWFAALALAASSALLAALLGMESGRVDYADLELAPVSALAVVGVLTAVAHTTLRLLLGWPAKQRQPEATMTRGNPLLVFLPERTPTAASQALAIRAIRAWIDATGGPVTRVAPAAAALRIGGAHLRLAQQAGLLPALFVDRHWQAANWQRLRPANEVAASVLPLAELYGGAAAWRTALAEAPDDARVLVIVGDSPLAWDTAFFDALPKRGEIVCDAAAMPPTRVDRQTLAFVDAARRDDWLSAFLQRQRPAVGATRRLLLLYAPPDVAMAQALAAALDGLSDPQGQRIVASPIATTLENSLAVLRLDGRSLATAVGLGARFAVRSAAGRPGLQLSLIKAMAQYWLNLYPARIDLLVLETAVASTSQAMLAGGLDRDADAVYSLLPAETDADDQPRLYERSAYRATWRLPPRSALDAHRVSELARDWLDGRWSPLPPTVTASSEATLEGSASTIAAEVPLPPESPSPPEPAPGTTPATATAKAPNASIAPETPAAKPSPVKAHVLYASQDQRDYQTLRRHLSVFEADGLIAFRQDAPRERDWAVEITATLAEAELVLTLFSAEFLASSHCLGELDQVLKRALSGQTRLIPIPLRGREWLKLNPLLARFPALPADGTPVAETPVPEQTFADIALAIRRIIDELRPKTTPDDPLSPPLP
ncbi:MAG: hypothetical protein JNL84_14765 [Candidatus Accumulibacter sp.]|nr:hypothetical protein [Accumulibacter sp.]